MTHVRRQTILAGKPAPQGNPCDTRKDGLYEKTATHLLTALLTHRFKQIIRHAFHRARESMKWRKTEEGDLHQDAMADRLGRHSMTVSPEGNNAAPQASGF